VAALDGFDLVDDHVSPIRTSTASRCLFRAVFVQSSLRGNSPIPDSPYPCA